MALLGALDAEELAAVVSVKADRLDPGARKVLLDQVAAKRQAESEAEWARATGADLPGWVAEAQAKSADRAARRAAKPAPKAAPPLTREDVHVSRIDPLIPKRGHNRRSGALPAVEEVDVLPEAEAEVACGRVLYLRNIDNPAIHRAMRFACGQLSCPRCRARWEAKVGAIHAEHFAEEGSTARRHVVLKSAVASLTKKIARHGGRHVKASAGDGKHVVILHTAGAGTGGELLADVPEALAAMLAGVPGRSGDRACNLTSSRAWAISHHKNEPRWEFLGLVGVSVAHAAMVARAVGLTVCAVDPSTLPASAGEAVDLLGPADQHDPAWTRFATMAKVVQPISAEMREARRRLAEMAS